MSVPKGSAAGTKARGDPASARDPVAAVGRAVGAALKFVKQCVPGASPRRRAPGAQRAREAPPVAKTLESGPSLERLRARLNGEVATLEREVETVHGQIARGGLGPDPSPTALLHRSRELRDELHRARQELARIERHLAREELLRSNTREAVRTTRSAAASPGDARRSEPQQGRKGGRVSGAGEVAEAASVTGARPVPRGEVARLRQALSARDPEARRAAVVRLGELASPEAVRNLAPALEDSNERVVLAALNALARTRQREHVPVFRRFLRHELAALRVAALRGLAAVAPKLLGARELAEALDDPDPEMRKAGAALLGKLAKPLSPEAAGALAFALRDPVPEVRVAAIDALRTCGEEAGVLRLIRAVADPVQPVREAALAAIRAMAGTNADAVGAGLDPAARAAALSEWWLSARVDLGLRAPRGGYAPEGDEAPANPEPEPDSAEPASWSEEASREPTVVTPREPRVVAPRQTVVAAPRPPGSVPPHGSRGGTPIEPRSIDPTIFDPPSDEVVREPAEEAPDSAPRREVVAKPPAEPLTRTPEPTHWGEGRAPVKENGRGAPLGAPAAAAAASVPGNGSARVPQPSEIPAMPEEAPTRASEVERPVAPAAARPPAAPVPAAAAPVITPAPAAAPPAAATPLAAAAPPAAATPPAAVTPPAAAPPAAAAVPAAATMPGSAPTPPPVSAPAATALPIDELEEPLSPEGGGDDDFLSIFKPDDDASADEEESLEGDEPTEGGGEEYENIFGNENQ